MSQKADYLWNTDEHFVLENEKKKKTYPFPDKCSSFSLLYFVLLFADDFT